MKAKQAIVELLDEMIETAERAPAENGNTKALIDRIKRDLSAIAEHADFVVDDDLEDDDAGLDEDDAAEGMSNVQTEEKTTIADAAKAEGKFGGKAGTTNKNK